jgi:hypothetical protein
VKEVREQLQKAEDKVCLREIGSVGEARPMTFVEDVDANSTQTIHNDSKNFRSKNDILDIRITQ